MKYRHMLIALTFTLCACAPEPSQNPALTTHAPHPIITAYTYAYSTKDIAAMQALMHPEIEWLSVDGSTVKTEVAGKAELSDVVESFFADPNMATGTLAGWSVNGNQVAVTETAHWTSKTGKPKSQSALVFYELDNNLIRRVYYFSAN